MAIVKVDKTTELVSTESLSYMRALALTVNASLLKPNTQMYAFFDGVDVNRYFAPINNGTPGTRGDPLVTSTNGTLSAMFYVPGKTFRTGKKSLLLTDKADYLDGEILGNTDVKATGFFTSTGALQKWRTTETSTDQIIVEQVIRIEVPVPAPLPTPAPTPTPIPNVQSDFDLLGTDPLAQSFFTYGINGGCFITSIDLWFQSKDSILPVWVEIHEMDNGYPSPKLVSEFAISVKNPSAVNTSNNSSVKTTFTFSELIYLEANRDYCFIVQSMSNKYNIWTSRMSEASIETGKIVFEQPYTGSLFKSENKVTWTAEQMEDIKFVLNKAKFDTSVIGNLTYEVSCNPVTIPCYAFSTISNTNYVYAFLPYKHALNNTSKITINCNTNGVYNGILGSKLNGSHDVLYRKNEFTVVFTVSGATATSTDYIRTGGLINDIQVDYEGSGYSDSNPPTLTISPPISGTNATATPIIKNGKLVDVIITNPGSGYFTTPTITISTITADPAILTPINDEIFVVTTNRHYHEINPAISTFIPLSSSITSTASTKLSEFEDGTISSYTSGKTYDVNLQAVNKFDNNMLLASTANEVKNMGGTKSLIVNSLITTTNENVSPILEVDNARMLFITNRVNNQKLDNTSVLITKSSGSVTGITLGNGGSGYSSAPTVRVLGSVGTEATVTCTIANGSVNGLSFNPLTGGGNGYFETPHVVFIGGGGSGATAAATISEFNSELLPSGGNAQSKYLTKTQRLESTVSSGIRIYVTAYSNSDSSFDLYIKTSLSASNIDHNSQEWIPVLCDVTRNKSSLKTDFFEYQFYLDNMNDFDTYTLKIVTRTLTPWDPPIIDDYRLIVLSS